MADVYLCLLGVAKAERAETLRLGAHGHHAGFRACGRATALLVLAATPVLSHLLSLIMLSAGQGVRVFPHLFLLFFF